MTDKHITVDSIRWHSVLPWLHLLRAAQLALRVRPVLLAMLAVLAMQLGYWVLFNRPIDQSNENPGSDGNPKWVLRAIDDSLRHKWDGSEPLLYSTSVRYLICDAWPWTTVVSAALELFEFRNSWPSVAGAWTNLLWSLLVWAIFGGAITRIAAVRFARDESLPLFAALKFSARNWQSYIYGPLLPMLGVGLLAACGLCVGWLHRWWNVESGGVLDVLGMILVLCGFAMAVLLLLMALCWPLMIAAISTEGSDGFDGLSRAFGYVLNRPWYFAFLLWVAHLVGMATFVVVHWIAVVALHLAEWGSGMPGYSGAGNWRSFADRVVFAVMVCFFWSATTVIYFLLRQSDDGTPLDQVYIPGPPPKAEPLPLVGVAASEQPIIERPTIEPVATRGPPVVPTIAEV